MAERAGEIAVVTELPTTPAPPSPVQPGRAKRVRPRPARTPLPAAFFVAISVLLSVSGLALWGAFYTLVLSSVQEHRAQHILYTHFRSEVAEGTAPTGGPIAHGAPVAVLDAPRAGLRHLMVVEGTTPRLNTGNCSLRICGVSRTEASMTAPANPRYFIAVAIRPPMPAKSTPSSSTMT